MCAECGEGRAYAKGKCRRCYNREYNREFCRAKNGQVGPFVCPDCGAETRAFKDWSGARCSDCRYKIRRERLKEYHATPEHKERKKGYAKHVWNKKDVARRQLYMERPEVRERERQRIHRRRAVRLAQTEMGWVSPDIRTRLYAAQGGKCAFCTKPLGGVYDLDHVVPLARGGLHDDANLQILCPYCNRSKGAKDPVEWAQSKGKLF